MSEQSLLVSRDGAIATVVINRPAKRNALDQATWRSLGAAFEALSHDEALRCVILRGAGTEAFAAGADISGFPTERSTPALVRTYTDDTDRATRAIAACRHPVIAMIHGFCLGGGLEIAVNCDIRIAGRSARFGIPVKRMGLFLSYDLLDSLIAIAGRATTMELVLEGRVFDAAEALERQLVSRLVDDAGLEAEAIATAERIADGAPLAARFHRRAIRRLGEPQPITEAEHEASLAYAESEDYRAAYKAFLAKEKPRFSGR
ncbi:MAG: enoyl-CoA hydratase/isomerase family protein [Alphaproteobacteria bacterium]|nr:enoyl-CoA hydratase/isomerase family protein [Alphaproteobacteria bacterium]